MCLLQKKPTFLKITSFTLERCSLTAKSGKIIRQPAPSASNRAPMVSILGLKKRSLSLKRCIQLEGKHGLRLRYCSTPRSGAVMLLASAVSIFATACCISNRRKPEHRLRSRFTRTCAHHCGYTERQSNATHHKLWENIHSRWLWELVPRAVQRGPVTGPLCRPCSAESCLPQARRGRLQRKRDRFHQWAPHTNRGEPLHQSCGSGAAGAGWRCGHNRNGKCQLRRNR